MSVSSVRSDKRLGVSLTVHRAVSASYAERLWCLYESCMRPVSGEAALEHFYDRAVFDSLVRSESVATLIAEEGDVLVGASLVTNDLNLVPQISPAFFRGLYPSHAARDALYYGIVVFADGRRGAVLSGRLMTETGQLVAREGGVLLFDVCDRKRSSLGIDKHASNIARWYPSASIDCVDRQSFFAITLPAPAEDRRFAACRNEARPLSQQVSIDLEAEESIVLDEGLEVR